MLNNAIQKLEMFLDMLNYSKPKIDIGNETIGIYKEDIIEILKLFKENYVINKKYLPIPTYIYLIKKNILFLNPQNGTLKPQSFLIWNAIKKVVE